MGKVARFCRGFVRIRVWGFSPERFLNLCSRRGILLWQIEREETDAYQMNLSLSDFRRLRDICKKAQVRVVVTGRQGLPFLLPTLWKRRVFAVGMILAILFWSWSAGYVWEIELEGNEEITQDVMTDFLNSQDVRIGMRKKDLDIASLEKEIRRTFSCVTWTSVKLRGTGITISLKENEVEAYREESGPAPPRDLISSYDGVVTDMIVRSGVPKVQIGDAVSQGTVLVEGRVPILSDDGVVLSYHEVVSDADIRIECAVVLSESLPFTYVEKTYTGRSSARPVLQLGQRDFALPYTEPYLVCDSVVNKKQPLLFGKLQIPVFWGSETYREYQNVEHAYTLTEAKTLLERKIIAFLATLEEKGVQIIEKDVRIDTRDGMWVAEGEILVLRPAGELVRSPDIPEADLKGTVNE